MKTLLKKTNFAAYKIIILLGISILLACNESPVSKDEQMDKAYAYVTGRHPKHPKGIKWVQNKNGGIPDAFILKDSEEYPVYKVSPGEYYATEINWEDHQSTWTPGKGLHFTAKAGIITYIGEVEVPLSSRYITPRMSSSSRAMEIVFKNNPNLFRSDSIPFIYSPPKVGD